jgi:hypothetical protein
MLHRKLSSSGSGITLSCHGSLAVLNMKIIRAVSFAFLKIKKTKGLWKRRNY